MNQCREKKMTMTELERYSPKGIGVWSCDLLGWFDFKVLFKGTSFNCIVIPGCCSKGLLGSGTMFNPHSLQWGHCMVVGCCCCKQKSWFWFNFCRSSVQQHLAMHCVGQSNTCRHTFLGKIPYNMYCVALSFEVLKQKSKLFLPW